MKEKKSKVMWIGFAGQQRREILRCAQNDKADSCHSERSEEAPVALGNHQEERITTLVHLRASP